MKCKNYSSQIYYYIIFLTLFNIPKISIAENSHFLNQLETEIVTLVKNISPAIVTISARYDYELIENSKSSLLNFKSEKTQPVEITNIGSGFIIDSIFIITKASVIMGSNDIQVTFYDSTVQKAECIGTDPELGLSLLKISNVRNKPLQFANSNSVKTGCWVLLLGNSMGTSPSVSMGMVNTIHANGTIQLAANIAAGNAGGAVFNTAGGLVGLLTMSDNHSPENSVLGSTFYENNNLLAIPSNLISASIKQIEERSKTPNGWIGVIGEDWPGFMGGVHINNVTAKGPADIAGVKIGDIIISINNKPINQTIDLANFIKYQHPGDEIKLQILRGSGMHNLTFKIGEQPRSTTAGYIVPRAVKNPTASAPPINTVKMEQPERNDDFNKKLLLMRINKLEHEIESLKSILEKEQ